MTCIVGVVDEGRVFLGGDSAASNTDSITTQKSSKVWVKEGFAFGYTSSFRMGQILRYSLHVPHRHSDIDVDDYIHTDFIEEVRRLFTEGGYTYSQSGRDSGGNFLLGHQGRLWEVQSDFSITESIHGYAAVGSGEHVALGSLYSTNQSPVRTRISTALKAAAEFVPSVRGPYKVVVV